VGQAACPLRILACPLPAVAGIECIEMPMTDDKSQHRRNPANEPKRQMHLSPRPRNPLIAHDPSSENDKSICRLDSSRKKIYCAFVTVTVPSFFSASPIFDASPTTTTALSPGAMYFFATACTWSGSTCRTFVV